MVPVAQLEDRTEIPFNGHAQIGVVGTPENGWATIYVSTDEAQETLKVLVDKKGVKGIRPDANGQVNGFDSITSTVNPKRTIRIEKYEE